MKRASLMLLLGLSVPALSASAEVSPPPLRLGDAARPLRHAVELTIRPGEDSFEGAIEIEVELKAATSLLWLHAKELVVEKASASAGGKTLGAVVVPGGVDLLGLSFAAPVGPGVASLQLAYRGRLLRTDTAGLFQQKDGEDWYVFSQFEATDARRAFPCFDEPSFKAPWRLTLRVPAADTAVSNAPIVSETDRGDGTKTVAFAETKPLPSYLVALAVGPFEVVDGGKAGAKATPLRFIVPRGKAARTRWAAEATPRILEILEDYFGTPFPYEKLDSLAVPQAVGFAAMENAGLITYVERVLTATPEEETAAWKRNYASVAAHEIAHQWLGDLVTMEFWDDLWLKESFATWMAPKVLHRWKPEWEADVQRVAARAESMRADTLVTARRIRQPIQSIDDIANAFDGITYGKGAAVLRMFEAWLGEEAFRAGIRRYLSTHAHGNASAGDFLQALEGASTPGVARAFSTFLDQPGVPVVSVDLRCGAGAPPRLALSQKRFLPVGTKGSADLVWQIPVCVRAAAEGKEQRVCRLMTAAAMELDLGTPACPDNVLANDGGAGYYLALYAGDLLGRLLEDSGAALPLADRVGVLRDVQQLADGGAIARGDALALVPAFARDPSRHVVAAAAAIAGGVAEHLVPPDQRPSYARFVRATFGPRARQLGFRARPGEDDDTRLLRRTVVGLVAQEGEDPELRAEAGRLARAWLQDRAAVDADMVDIVLEAAAREGDRSLLDRMMGEVRKAPERRDRQRLLAALGSFRDPALAAEARKLTLDGDLDLRETMATVWAGLDDGATREGAWDFVKVNFEALAARLPQDYPAFLPFTGGRFCDAERRADVESFFKERTAKYAGGPRNLAQALEAIDLCVAARAAQEPAVRGFLKGQ